MTVTRTDRTGAAERLEAELAVVSAREPTVLAWVARHDPDELRRRLEDCPAGPLEGFTLGVKDVIDTADLPTERNSPLYAGRRPTVDAACVTLARAAGALVVGKTVTTELAYAHPGPTTNPHAADHTPGGSSSGSAAAVAAGMVRIAFGTQTGGSVIRPASFCGVIGFKPTFDVVPTRGVSPLAPSLDTVGWYGRTVSDIAAVFDALTPRGAPLGAGRPRLGLYRTHDWPQAAEETRAAVTGAAARLAEAGATVIELDDLDAFAPLAAAHGVIMSAEAHASLAHERLHHAGELSTPLRRLLDAGGRIDADRYAAAQRAAAGGRAALEELMDQLGLDALLTPATVGSAPAGLDDTGDPRFNRVWTLLGVPAISLPGASGPTGLPVGVQLIGTRWADRALLAVAEYAAPVLDPS